TLRNEFRPSKFARPRRQSCFTASLLIRRRKTTSRSHAPSRLYIAAIGADGSLGFHAPAGSIGSVQHQPGVFASFQSSKRIFCPQVAAYSYVFSIDILHNFILFGAMPVLQWF